MISLDTKDLALLAALQRDGDTTAAQLADTLAMSSSQIGRRRQRLEAAGYILRTVSVLDPAKLGLTVQAFVQIQTQAQTGETHRSITRLIALHPEIVACWTLTGEADYILRVHCTDLTALNRLVQDVLLPHASIGRVQTQIVMEQIKDDTALPLPHPR